MKRFIKSKKGIALLATFVVAAVAAIGAYAYFTSTGSGSGSGTVGTATTWSVNGGSVVGTLYPDASYSGPDQGVVTAAYVKNQATSGNQNLNKIVATISGVTPLAHHDFADNGEPDCATTDFQFNSPATTWSGSGTQTATILPNDDLAPGASYTIGDLNVVMVDNHADQNNCQGATVTVTFNAS